MTKQKLNALNLGYAVAIVSALGMFLLSIGANLGIYTSAAEQMARWHMFFDFSILGTITGMIESAVHGFIWAWLVAVIYNKFQ